MEERDAMSRWPELLQQGAQWLAGAALEPLRDRMDSAAAAYRRELRRIAATYLACRLLTLFLGGAAGLVALAVMLACWNAHPVLAATSVAAVFLLVAAGCAIAVVRLGRPHSPGHQKGWR